MLSIYRRLLKSVDKHITAVTGNVLWRDYVRSEFRLDEQTDDIHAKLQDAADYIYMLESVHESKVHAQIPGPIRFVFGSYIERD